MKVILLYCIILLCLAISSIQFSQLQVKFDCSEYQTFENRISSGQPLTLPALQYTFSALQPLSFSKQNRQIYNYTASQKKGDTILLSISLLNIDRFSQFFHQRTQLELCNKIINKDPTSPQMCCYTTL